MSQDVYTKNPLLLEPLRDVISFKLGVNFKKRVIEEAEKQGKPYYQYIRELLAEAIQPTARRPAQVPPSMPIPAVKSQKQIDYEAFANRAVITAIRGMAAWAESQEEPPTQLEMIKKFAEYIPEKP